MKLMIFKVYLQTVIFKKNIKMRIFGIDPGIAGAIAILDDKKIYDVIDLPTMSDGKKNKDNLIVRIYLNIFQTI